MNCALISAHGVDIDQLLTMGRQPKPERKDGELLVKVHSVALAPGDYRVMKGSCDFFQSPGSFPYIPGGDFAGVVEEADKNSRFHQGDEIIAMFELPRPLHALAEYAVVKEKLAAIKPKEISWLDAPCITSSAVAAVAASKRYITEGSRILILGGGGGVGTLLIQLAKLQQASFVATTSTQSESFLKALGADNVIDYRTQNWWDIPEFEDSPFDVIFDLGVGKKEAWDAAKNYSILKKSTGRFVAFSSFNADMQMHNLGQVIGFMAVMQYRSITSKCWPYNPEYIWHNELDLPPGKLEEIIKLFQTGKVKAVLDPVSPLPFTKEGITKGFHVMKDRKAHGKVVVKIV